jgi:hypothetical protein
MAMRGVPLIAQHLPARGAWLSRLLAYPLGGEFREPIGRVQLVSEALLRDTCRSPARCTPSLPFRQDIGKWRKTSAIITKGTKI